MIFIWKYIVLSLKKGEGTQNWVHSSIFAFPFSKYWLKPWYRHIHFFVLHKKMIQIVYVIASI